VEGSLPEFLNPNWRSVSLKSFGKCQGLCFVSWSGQGPGNQTKGLRGTRSTVGFENPMYVLSRILSYLTRLFSPPSKLHVKIIKFFWPKRSVSSPRSPWRRVWRLPGKTPLVSSGTSHTVLEAWFQHHGECEPRTMPCLP
jgi:hypothetical protein